MPQLNYLLTSKPQINANLRRSAFICGLILPILFILSTNVLSQQPAPVDHVRTVQNDPRVKAAFDHIDKTRDDILREWIAITEINAPSKQEQERAKFIESLLRKYKLEIRYDSAGNLIATRKGTGGGPVTDLQLVLSKQALDEFGALLFLF